jgi:hypothetical protein
VAGAGPAQRFPFVQFEFAFPLGPPDGRYVSRAEAGGDPERIVVLRTVGAPRRSRLSRRARRVEPADGGPEPVPTARATIVRAAGLGSAEEAEGWLDGLGRDRAAIESEAEDAARELNALLRAHRAAALDPYVRDVAPEGATSVRVGYGSGDEVADGRFTAALELPPAGTNSRVRRRSEALAPDERLAALLARREEVLACEELVLRARTDLDAGRPREAALQARVALEAALAELTGDETGLASARDEVARAANMALRADPEPALQDAVAAAVAAIETALRRRRLGRGAS